MKDKIFIVGLSGTVTLAGALVMFGWFFNIDILKSIMPFWVTMKFTTALSFFCSGFILFFIYIYVRGRITTALTFLPVFCLTVALVMSAIITATILNMKTGIENLFIKEDVHALLSVYPGRPSVGTIFSFILIVLSGILTLIQQKQIKTYLFVFGALVTAVGIIALIGYFLNNPVLYFYIEDKSTAMAFHTAMLFFFSGIVLMRMKNVQQ